MTTGTMKLTLAEQDRAQNATDQFRRGFEYALTTTDILGLTGLWDLPGNEHLIYWEIGAYMAGYNEGRRHRHLIDADTADRPNGSATG